MALSEFLRETLGEVRSQMQEGSPFGELVFSEIVMKHLAENGMTFDDPAICHYRGKIGQAIVRLSGYAMSDDGDQLDLFVSLYEGVEEVAPIPDAETKSAAEQCLRFLTLCAKGTLAPHLEESTDVRSLALLLQECYGDLEQIRVYVLTDRVAKTKSFKPREISGRMVHLEIMDIERLYRHVAAGKPRDELVVDFTEVSGAPLQCVYIPGDGQDYDYALAAIPGEALRHLYERFSTRLLEANVRSFLSAKGKGVNAGIQHTLRATPERFMAYNNGVVIVADEIRLAQTPEGGTGIAWMQGMQIVNGGQTTASIYFAKRKYPATDLSAVRVPAKIIVLRSTEAAQEEALISDISRYANSQNAVRQSDLSANKPFHVEVEKLSLSVFCPDGVSRWFYERASGSYNTILAREGTTPAKLKALKTAVPPARRITKTDLAKYIHIWDQKPDVVSLGLQKNFDKFMASFAAEAGADQQLPSVADYKKMIAKAKLFKDANKLIRPMFPSFQGNVVVYVLSLLSFKLGDRIDLERIWNKQGASPELLALIQTWAGEVNSVLHKSSGGRMVSEWAKKPECRIAVFEADYSPPPPAIPEILPE